MREQNNRIRILLIVLIALGAGVVFMLQSIPETRRVIIVSDCGTVERTAELFDNIDRLEPFLYEHGIDTVYGDTLEGCGYILQWNNDAVEIDTIMSARDLKIACQRFFKLDTLEQTPRR